MQAVISRDPALPRKRVLIVASSFAPVMPANMQRVRMLSWYLPRYGWDFEILTLSAAFQNAYAPEPYPSQYFAPETPCVEAEPDWTGALMGRIGMRGLSWKGLFPLYKAGAGLLNNTRFDLVFISTTAFNFFCLGRLWKRRFGVPYVLDFQDPWVKDDAHLRTSRRIAKAKITESISPALERFAVKKADGIISVSPNYLEQLNHRYPGAPMFERGLCATIPFGVLEQDFVETVSVSTGVGSDTLNVAYVGVGSVVMERSFARLSAGIARLRATHPELVGRLRIRLLGTDGNWNEGRPKILKDVANRAGIGDLVTEDPGIVSYSQALSAAASGGGLLVLGVDDPAYMASKLFPYALTGKPLLACIHWKSQMNSYFAHYPDLGGVIHFGGPDETESSEDRTILAFLEDISARRFFERADVRRDHSAEAMTRNVASFFDRCIA